MRIGLVVDRCYQNNEIFNRNNPANPGDWLFPLRILREWLSRKGITLLTHDLTEPEKTWGYLFFNSQRRFFRSLRSKNYSGFPFLLALESEVVDRRNWDTSRHRLFDVVFTWNPELISSRTAKPEYVRFYWPNDLSGNPVAVPFGERDNLCVMMAGNKWKPHPKELYSERIRAINWFRKNHPDQFDLYGYGWDIAPALKVKRLLQNGLLFLQGGALRYFSWRRSPCYKGVAASKKKVLERYKFCLCYENARDIPSYITEKIFDCFMAGVVPIYLGWGGADTLIPPGTFIDKRKFSTYDELFRYISCMGPEEHKAFLDAAADFVKSPEARKFDADSFADILAEGMGLKGELAKEGKKR